MLPHKTAYAQGRQLTKMRFLSKTLKPWRGKVEINQEIRALHSLVIATSHLSSARLENAMM